MVCVKGELFTPHSADYKRLSLWSNWLNGQNIIFIFILLVEADFLQPLFAQVCASLFLQYSLQICRQSLMQSKILNKHAKYIEGKVN